ncbi:OsmC family protein [Pseudactinotalea sp. HY158]|uniref:OsmC family protein n=1 Tax=Pseudactinotalea sp. HY158 TaxID=2654547 RepID=UPI00129C2920|nr:OsmC family protein [Pseudactinotalea sp. HY158]QGH70634.1 OsmC family peroxiredoxin [Pseudactinotalea sp. HY158]
MTTTTIDLPDLAKQTTEQLAAGAPARVGFRTESRLTPGTNTAVDITAGRHEFTIDEPPALGGEDTGANPVEHLLAALSACQVITVRVWAAKLGLTVDTVAVDAHGTLDLRGFFGVDPAVRAGFQDIELDLTLTGPETEEAYAELIRVVEAQCPVLDNLTAGVPVTTRAHVAATA